MSTNTSFSSSSRQPLIYRSTFPEPKALRCGDTGNLFDLISQRAMQRPGDAAFIRDDGKIFTNKDVISLSRRLAWSYRNVLGLSPGGKVALFSPNHSEYGLAIYAAEIAGLTAVLINPASTAKELVTFLDMSKADVLLAHPSVMDKARVAAQANASLRLFTFADADESPEQADVDVPKHIMSILADDQELETTVIERPREQTVFICFSSGTTGLAKGVEITHANVTASLAQMLVTHEGSFTSRDIQIGVLPFCHIYGLVKLLHHPFMIGMPVVVMARFDMRAFCEKVVQYGATIALLVPPIILLLSSSPIAQEYNLSTLKIIQSGGAPLSADLARQVCSRWPNLRIVQGYGLTESCPSVICTGPAHLPSSPESVGRIAPGVEVRLVDDNGDDVDPNSASAGTHAQGELWIRGPSIMKGYLSNDDANLQAFGEGRWFKTGDIAAYHDNEVFIVGRKKELIKYKGFQVPPAELEALLLTHPKVADVIVVGIVDHSQATELPRAYIVPRDLGLLRDEHAGARLSADIAKWTAANVSNHKKLRGGVYLVASVPKSPSGKLLRRVIMQQIEMAAATTVAAAAAAAAAASVTAEGSAAAAAADSNATVSYQAGKQHSGAAFVTA